MKLKHEIRGRLITIPGISSEPIFLTGELVIQHWDGEGLVICAEFFLTYRDGCPYKPTPMAFPLSGIMDQIEA